MKLDRIDLSDTLIHFVSELDMSSTDYNMSEMHPKEYAMNGDMVEYDLLSPFFILRRIIRNLQLISTWSYRKGSRTIYGDFPAVCFTEMPIAEFVKTSIDRSLKGQKISNYALIFDKKQMFTLGSRPVIYGTSQDVIVVSSGVTKKLSPAIYDDKELYRYVAFKLDRLPYPIDWTHEREWRWPNYDYKYYPIDQVIWGDEEDYDDELNELCQQRENSRIDFHGLNLEKENLSNVGIIIKTEEQARLVIRDILTLIDSQLISKSLFGFILFFNKLEQNLDKLYDKAYVNSIINSGLIKIEQFFNVDQSYLKSVQAKLDKICSEFNGYNRFDKQHQGWQYGISYPCLNDNQIQLTRALVELGYIKVTKLGRYLVDLPILQPTECLENNEKFVREVLNPRLEEEFDVELTYYSVGGLFNKTSIKDIGINDVPFYTEPNDDEWNSAHKEEDY